MLELRTLGSIDVRTDEGAVVTDLNAAPKRLALLAYLAASVPSRTHMREQLVSLFWPDATFTRARASLRQSVRFIRHLLGDALLLSVGREGLRLDHDCLWCDVWAFEYALDNGCLREAVALYRGEFLAGLTVRSASAEFEEWLDGERARLRQRAVQACAMIALRAEHDGAASSAAELWEHMMELSPYDEYAIQHLLRVLSAQGERSEAIRRYGVFARALERRFGTRPMAETAELVGGAAAGLEPMLQLWDGASDDHGTKL